MENSMLYTRPSKQLLESYRQKIRNFNDVYDNLLKKLENLKVSSDVQHSLEKQVDSKEAAICELQKSLSAVEKCLYEEREEKLRLQSENDRLKIQQFQDEQKVQDFAVHGSRSLPADMGQAQSVLNIHIKGRQRRKPAAAGTEETAGKCENFHDEMKVLQLQVFALQSQLEEQSALARRQVKSLTSNLEMREQELQKQLAAKESSNTSLRKRLGKCERLLYDSVQEVVELSSNHQRMERSWMDEKDTLLTELDRAHEEMNDGKENRMLKFMERTGKKMDGSKIYSPDAEKIEKLEAQLEESLRMCAIYRRQVIDAEKSQQSLKEEAERCKIQLKERTQKMVYHMDAITQNCQELERRRLLDSEGFQNDIKFLREKLRTLEKNIASALMSRPSNNRDLEMLAEVHQKTSHSKKIAGQLNTIKARIYALERDIKKAK